MTRNLYALTLSLVILSFFQPVLAQGSAEEGKVVSQVRLRDFEGAWSEDQVREWVNGPAKKWLDKTDVFVSMIKPENWVYGVEMGDMLVAATRLKFNSSKKVLESLQIHLRTLSLQPYDLNATVWSENHIGLLAGDLRSLADLNDKPNFSGGPSTELAIELINHSSEGHNLSTDLTPHLGAIFLWYGAAVAPPQW